MTTASALPNDEPQPPQLQPNHMMLMMWAIWSNINNMTIDLPHGDGGYGHHSCNLT